VRADPCAKLLGARIDALAPRCRSLRTGLIAHLLHDRDWQSGCGGGPSDGVSLHIDEIGMLRKAVAHDRIGDERITPSRA